MLGHVDAGRAWRRRSDIADGAAMGWPACRGGEVDANERHGKLPLDGAGCGRLTHGEGPRSTGHLRAGGFPCPALVEACRLRKAFRPQGVLSDNDRCRRSQWRAFRW